MLRVCVCVLGGSQDAVQLWLRCGTLLWLSLWQQPPYPWRFRGVVRLCDQRHFGNGPHQFSPMTVSGLGGASFSWHLARGRVHSGQGNVQSSCVERLVCVSVSAVLRGDHRLLAEGALRSFSSSHAGLRGSCDLVFQTEGSFDGAATVARHLQAAR